MSIYKDACEKIAEKVNSLFASWAPKYGWPRSNGCLPVLPCNISKKKYRPAPQTDH